MMHNKGALGELSSDMLFEMDVNVLFWIPISDMTGLLMIIQQRESENQACLF